MPAFGMLCLAGLMALGAGTALAQGYPSKPLRIVTSGAGGGNDLLARLIAQGISGPLGQPVIVDNRASGVIPGELVSRAPADGYTLLVIGSSFVITPLLQKVPYDPVRDFTPVTVIATSPNVLVVHPAVPAASVKELIALAKARPGTIHYAATAAGSGSHLTAELFRSMADVNIVRVPYKSTGTALTSLIGGEVNMMFPSASAASPHTRAGRLKALAATGPAPSELTPGLPTMHASGVPGFRSVSLDLAFVPARTPQPVVNRLNQEMVRLLNSPETRKTLVNSGSEAAGTPPAESVAMINDEVARWSKVIKSAGIRAD